MYMDLVKTLFVWAPFYPQIRNFQHLIEAAIAVVSNGYPARDLIVIGVTGTDGKTTATNLIGSILNEAGLKTAVISTINASIGGKTIDTGFHVTTPNARDLQRLLRKITNSGIKYVVIETSSHALDQHRVFGCNFKYGVLTNITHDHLDYHKTWENYRNAKAKLFRNVKVAVLNKDDASFEFIANVARNAKVISYSLKQHAMMVARNIKIDMSGTSSVIRDEIGEIEIVTPLLGDFNVSNILAATGVARDLGVSLEVIQKALSKFNRLSGRLEKVKNNWLNLSRIHRKMIISKRKGELVLSSLAN